MAKGHVQQPAAMHHFPKNEEPQTAFIRIDTMLSINTNVLYMMCYILWEFILPLCLQFAGDEKPN